jgi:nucleoside-diphosphate-sugar epimerase
MKIVITGALGHIGSKFIRTIPDQFPDSQCILIDNLSSQRYCSLFNLPKTGKYRFYEKDIFDPSIEQLIIGSDVVVHLAAITDAESSVSQPEEVKRMNYKGTEKIASICAKNDIPIIFISTTSVYGTQEGMVDENCPDSGLKPQSPYAESKLFAEKVILRMGEERKLKFVIFRFGTIFGVSPGMRFHTAVNKFIWQACAGIPFTVWKTALHQKRPYLDLDDAINALIFIISKKMWTNTIYNVVTLNATVNEIITCITSHIHDTKIELVDTRIMNQLSYEVDNTKFKEKGFQYLGNLERSVVESIELLKGIRGF